MFELLATVDPFSALLGSLWLFAAGLFPVGFMLGSSCSPCCGEEPCAACTQGRLPETITATLDGFTDFSKTYLTSLTFESCYGSGASGQIESPGHAVPETDPVLDRGPVGSATILNGGSGYAKLGRTAPTVTVTGTSHSGTGATFDVTLAQSQDSCGLDLWAVSKVTATGGEGYIDGEELTFSVAEGDTEEASAFATIQLGRVAPTVTVTSTSGSGSGATFDVTLAQSQGTDGRDRWAVSKVTMAGGTGYETFDTLTFGIAEGDTEEQAASAQLIIGKAQPTLTLPGNATGTVSTQPIGDGTYAVSAVTVTSGGSGYTDGEYLIFDKAADDVTVFNATAIARVNAQTGALESVELGQGGSYYKDDPDAREVFVTYGGVYYREDQDSKLVAVTDGGAYYREDASLPPYIATVTVGINQTAPSQGSGASISATVDSDTASETFGQITGLTISNGGDGYLAWKWTTNDCCGHYLNGQSIVLTRFKDSNAAACEAATLDFFGQYNITFSPEGGEYYSVPSSCVYTTQFCGGWTSPFIWGPPWHKVPVNDKLQLYVGFRGEGQRPVIKLGAFCWGGRANNSSGLGVACLQDWIADEPIESCSQFSFSATPPGRPSVTVNTGGTYDPDWRFSGGGADSNSQCPSCNVCCQGDEEPPEELEVLVADEWTTNRPAGLPNFSGTYVATSNNGYRWAFGGNPPGFERFGGTFGFLPCHDGDWGFLFTPPRADCETCIKKCRAVFAHIFGEYWHANIPRRVGIAPAAPASDCGECEDTPLCSMSGRSYALSFMTDSFSVTTGYGDGVTHAATVTIQ